MRRLPGAVLLLLAIAIAHQVIAGPGRLSPWKGGGFGMFATLESPASRFVRVQLATEQGRFAVSIPPKLSAEVSQLKTWPTEGRTQKLAERLAALRWVTLDPKGENILPYLGLQPAEPVPPGAQLLRVETVEVELRRYAFDGRRSPAIVRATTVTRAQVRAAQ